MKYELRFKHILDFPSSNDALLLKLGSPFTKEDLTKLLDPNDPTRQLQNNTFNLN